MFSPNILPATRSVSPGLFRHEAEVVSFRLIIGREHAFHAMFLGGDGNGRSHRGDKGEQIDSFSFEHKTDGNERQRAGSRGLAPFGLHAGISLELREQFSGLFVDDPPDGFTMNALQHTRTVKRCITGSLNAQTKS
jgi:hypothetical protein